MVTMPYVMDAKDGRGSDLFSRLLQDRIVLLTGEINDDSAAQAELVGYVGALNRDLYNPMRDRDELE